MTEETSGIHILNFQPSKPDRRSPKEQDPKHGDALKNLTLHLVDTYAKCSADFGYTLAAAPRRVLTKLAKGVHNSGYDNAEHDYICRVGDKIVNPDNQTYEILERLGHGTFGQVLKCLDGSKNAVALKIIKNKPAYFHQALVEVHILKMLNTQYDPEDEFRIVRMRDFFVYRKHLCISFELLSVNLYDVLKQNSFRGVSMALIRVLTEQLLRAMECLRKADIIHCDLKPENVLLSSMNHTKIKLVDFGSACFQDHTVYSYIQSRFYRSPEVLLGLTYTTAIDMWSLACICSELFLGLPIFPGHSEYDQVRRHVEILGLPPESMLRHGRHTRKYFHTGNDSESEESDGTGQPKRSKKKKQLEFSMQLCYEFIILQACILKRVLKDGSFDRDYVKDITLIRHELIRSQRMLKSSRENAAFDFIYKLGYDDFVNGDAGCVERADIQARYDKLETLLKDIKESVKDIQDHPKSREFEELASEIVDKSEKIRLVQNAMPVAETTAPQDGKDTSTTVATSEQPSAQDQKESLLIILKRKIGLLPEIPEKAPSNCVSESASDAQEQQSVVGADSEASTTAPSVQAKADQKKAEKSNKPKRPIVWQFKSRELYERDEHRKEPQPKKYFNFTCLHDMVQDLPYKQGLSKRAKQEDKDRRRCFLQFLCGTLNPNPDERWTPKQAVFSPFISGMPYDPEFKVCFDKPVPSFLAPKQPKTAVERTSGTVVGNVEVPPLPKDALTSGGFSGGGSARTYSEKGGVGSNLDADQQPQSAPASTRGPVEKGAASEAASGFGAMVDPRGTQLLWSQLMNQSTPATDDKSESYRPPLECLGEDFFRTSPRTAIERAYEKERKRQVLSSQMSSQDKSSTRKSMPDMKAAGAGGASFCSSASETGSTPNPRQGNNSHAVGTPPSVGSPMSLQGDTRKSAPALSQSLASPGGETRKQQPSAQDQSKGSAANAGNPNASVAGTNRGPNSGTPISSAHTPQGGVPHTALGRPGGSQTGSRGSSPWHLPSPHSELSTASERVNSSQLSGSDSCGETALPHEGGHACQSRYSLDDFPMSGEDPSQSDSHWRSHQPSDSDGTNTPGSHDAIGTNRTEEEQAPKDAQHALWENIKAEMARVELSRDRLPRRFDITQSPGSTGSTSTMANFREKMGMNESGPVIPFGAGARRDPNTTTAGSNLYSPPSRQQPEGGSQQSSGNPESKA